MDQSYWHITESQKRAHNQKCYCYCFASYSLTPNIVLVLYGVYLQQS